jgi:hypothetical protein
MACAIGRGSARLSATRAFLDFLDGAEGVFDLSDTIFGERRSVCLFVALRDGLAFAAVYVQHGAVTWRGGLDLAPDARSD